MTISGWTSQPTIAGRVDDDSFGRIVGVPPTDRSARPRVTHQVTLKGGNPFTYRRPCPAVHYYLPRRIGISTVLH